MSRLVAVGIVLLALLAVAGPSRAISPNCTSARGTTCAPVGGGLGADPGAGDFHGLLAVRGVPWVLDLAAHSGDSADCGDCTWTLVLACDRSSPGDPTGPTACVGARNSAVCKRGQLLYRLYLTTEAIPRRVVGEVCIGGPQQPVEVGVLARADVQRYLKDVRPPDLVIASSPPGGTLAGLTTSFTAVPPAGLAPVPFGTGEVTETITITPAALDWRWGDGSRTGWFAATGSTTHAFLHGGVARIRLRTRWGASYTITFQGHTIGPYDATGQLVRAQRLALPVGTSEPTLVSR